MTFSYRAGFVALTALLIGCSDGELILEGARQTPREAQIGVDAPSSEAAPLSAEVKSAPIALAAQQANADWTHRGGNAAHQPGHAAYSGGLAPVWGVRIGQGDSRKHRITADPVVAGGRIYTLDSASTVAATSTSGAAVWQADLTPASDRAGDATGGGLAYGEGMVFATTGYG
ncbi:MAG: quinoprotein, partial [Albidovulum sp.]